MRNSNMIRGVAAMAVLAVLVAGCAGQPGPKTVGGAGKYPVSIPGESYLEKQLELRSVTSPAEGGGKATFVVENVSGLDLEDVTASVRFYMPPTGGGKQEWDVEVQDQNVNFFSGSRVSVSATPSQPDLVKGWQLLIEPLRTVGDPAAGTDFLEGDLRCVGLVNDLTAMRPAVSFTLKNMSRSAVEAPHYRVVFRRGGKVIGGTEWQASGQTIPAGGTTTLSPDLSGVGSDLGGATAVLQLQKSIL